MTVVEREAGLYYSSAVYVYSMLQEKLEKSNVTNEK